MLHLGNMLYNRIFSIPIICTMMTPKYNTEFDDETQEFLKRVKKAAIYSFVDMVIVGGIVFFSSMAALGTGDLLVNAKISFISSITIACLSFFTEMRNSVNKINDKDNTKT